MRWWCSTCLTWLCADFGLSFGETYSTKVLKHGHTGKIAIRRNIASEKLVWYHRAVIHRKQVSKDAKHHVWQELIVCHSMSRFSIYWLSEWVIMVLRGWIVINVVNLWPSVGASSRTKFTVFKVSYRIYQEQTFVTTWCRDLNTRVEKFQLRQKILRLCEMNDSNRR